MTYVSGDVTVLLRDIMTQARNLTGAERCSLFLVDKRTNELVAKVFDVADDAEQIVSARGAGEGGGARLEGSVERYVVRVV